MSAKKLQIALYWGAGCGGCDVAVLDTNEFILDVAALADIRLWPIAVDGKYQDVEKMADGELDLTLFNGAVRNSENEHIAKLLRQKSKLMVAFGACAHMGGIPGLANFTSKEKIFATAYLDNPSIEPGNHTVPLTETKLDGKTLNIPTFYGQVYKLNDVVEVDYYVPGCPPAPAQVKAVLLAVAQGQLPAKGSVVGASERAVCEDCLREKKEKKITHFYRPWQIIQDPKQCLMDQGILCVGSATRSGCGVRCPNTGQGCRGCYGPLPGVMDHGAKILSSVSSIIDAKAPEEIQKILEGIPDFAAIAYRFGLPASLMQRNVSP